MELETLIKKFFKYKDTSPITKLKDKSVSFIRNEKYLPYLKNVKEDVWIIAPRKLKDKITQYQERYCPTVNVYYTHNPEFEFVLYHNKIHENKPKTSPRIGTNCRIHSSTIIGAEGLKVINAPNGEKIQFFHSGHLIVNDNVNIGPYSVIHRGLFGVTTIGAGSKIGTRCVVGYNCHIGANNVLAPGVIFNGGVYTGANCWFGSSTTVKHYIKLCDNVALGMSSVVVKNINTSGIYVGAPAKYIKAMEDGWTFWQHEEY